MVTDRISRWLTVGANFGVLVGIAFVILEIRQSSDIATAQVRLDYAAGWRSIDEKRQDEAFALVLSKSLLRPDELSFSEIVQLDGYYIGVIDQMLSAYTAENAGLRDAQLQGTAAQVAFSYFSNAYAQAWWQHSRQAWSQPGGGEFQRIMDKAIASASKRGNQQYYEGIQRQLSRVAKDASSSVDASGRLRQLICLVCHFRR